MIDSSVKFEDKESTYIGDYAIIGPGVELAAGVQVHAHAVLKEDVVLGTNTIVDVHASVQSATIGKECWIGPGVRIGWMTWPACGTMLCWW